MTDHDDSTCPYRTQLVDERFARINEQIAEIKRTQAEAMAWGQRVIEQWTTWRESITQQNTRTAVILGGLVLAANFGPSIVKGLG